MNQSIKDILSYWFGALHEGWVATDKFSLWFGGHQQDDDIMRQRFGTLIEQACASDLNHWAQSDEGRMALIILSDQMTRASRRGHASAFAGDELALSVCKEGIANDCVNHLPAVYQLFYYLPLEHSENLANQEQSVRCYQQLLAAYPQHAKPLEGSLTYAIKHRDIIAQFGRFPHRNAILARPSTDDEQLYLSETKERFGQKPIADTPSD